MMQEGVAHHQAGRFAEAERVYRQVITRDPRNADAMHLLGLIAHQQGDTESALKLIQSAIAIRPVADFYVNAGVVLRKLGRTEEAIAAYHSAVRFGPRVPEAHNGLGLALNDAGKSDEALRSIEQALRLRPNWAEGLNALGNVYMAQEKWEQAENALTRALQLVPNYAEALANLGNALEKQGKLSGAVATGQRAVAINPRLFQAFNNLGNALRQQGQLGAAIDAYRRALAIDPDNRIARKNLVTVLNFVPRLEPEARFRGHREWGQRFADPLKPATPPPVRQRASGDRLRIGYVSADLRASVVATFLEPIVARHHRDRVEVFAYSDVARGDNVTERIRNSVQHWREIVGVSDERVAEMVRADGIDVLVDLMGHIDGNRLTMFARKPAPVQVTYLGYPNTTGMEAMDFRLTDAYADPPGMTEALHTEKLVRLPKSAWCYGAPDGAPEVTELPAIKNGFVSFGCFNDFQKVNEDVVRVWAALLQRVTGSRLVLKAKSLRDPGTQQLLLAQLAQHGIGRERVEFIGWQSTLAGHLGSYAKVDIGLDPWPYHGTTTTCEAMWMGVPVITLAGKTHVSRVGVSLLSNVGLEDWVANSEEEYVAIGEKMAADIAKLKMLRAGMRERMKASPLMDAEGFATNLEDSFEAMVRAKS